MEEIRCFIEGARIAHWTPGRIRIAFPEAHTADRFAEAVGQFGGVTSARANSLTGSVLIHYQNDTEDVAAILGHLEPDRRRAQHTGTDPQPGYMQIARGVEAGEVVHRLVLLIGAILTGDLVGIVSWLLTALFETRQARAQYPSYAYLQAA